MDETILASLDTVNAKVFGPGSRLGLRWVDFADLREQDLNANVMPPEMFNALVSNVRKNGTLESIPLTANREGSSTIEVVSGHHRIRAAREAGQQSGIVLHYRDLTPSEIKAKQLAHNSISGTSDPQIVADIFGQIATIDLQIESYIDPTMLGNVPDPVSFQPIDIDPLINSRVVTIVFLDTQARDFSNALDLLTAVPDAVYVANAEAFDQFRDAVKKVRTELDVKSIPSALAAMARIVMEHLTATAAERDA